MMEDGVTKTPKEPFRWLPSERVLWEGGPTSVPFDRRFFAGALLAFALATVAALFAGLLRREGLEGEGDTAALAASFAAVGILVILVPAKLREGVFYGISDRRIVVRRFGLTRSMDRASVTFGRVEWNPSAPGVGHLELLVAVPFGPLARQQRVVLQDVPKPDYLLALVRGAEPGPNTGDGQVPLMERLDDGEEVRWGGVPEGWLIGGREIATIALGVFVTALGLVYGYHTAGILLGLEERGGLRVGTPEWLMLFFAVAITWVVLVAIGAYLVWHGLFRARNLGRDTEYVVTNTRVLIRRGTIELSLDRRRVVDVAEAEAPFGLRHLVLVLDGPGSRALADSGALRSVLPARASVPPILFEIRDVDGVRASLGLGSR
jgi:hypothetical protein